MATPLEIDLPFPTDGRNYDLFLRGTHRKLRDHEAEFAQLVFNVRHRRFGATGDGATDDTAAIQGAIDAAADAGGGIVYFPPGDYLISSALDVSERPNLTLKGANSKVSTITSAHTGDGIRSVEVINSSVRVNLVIEDMGIRNSNGANTGAAFNQVGGTFIHVHRVYTLGFRYSVVFDQTELADIDGCEFEFPLGAGVWLVQGDDHTPGALNQFTNRIGISRCQFNNTSGVGVALVDDGGLTHEIERTNFNGFATHIRVCGAAGWACRNCEFEGSTVECVRAETTTYFGGDPVGSSSSLVFMNNLFAPPNTVPAIQVDAGGDLVLIGNVFGTGAANAVPVQGTGGNTGTIVSLANRVTGTVQQITDWRGYSTSLVAENPTGTSSGPGGSADIPTTLGALKLLGYAGRGADLWMRDDDAASDTKSWRWQASDGALALSLWNDAENSSATLAYFSRSGTSPAAATFLTTVQVDRLQINSGALIQGHLTGTTTWDPPNLSTNAETATTLTVTGAALGDVVALSFSNTLQGMILHGHVSAADTVTAVLRNGTGGAIDLASGTLRAVVWKY